MRKSFLLLATLFFALACSNSQKIQTQFQQVQIQVQKKFAPDKSLAIAQFQLVNHDGQWILKGETNIPNAKEAMLRKVDSLLGTSVQDSVLLLPDPALGDSTFALVTVSMANLRRQPRHAAELLDQRTTGSVLKLLKRKGSWYLVQTSYDYLGWMTKTSFERTDAQGVKAWKESQRMMVTVPVDRIFTFPATDAVPVCDVVLNGEVKLLKKSGRWTKVELPDRRVGYILSAHLAPVKEAVSPSEVKPEQILDVAFQLMGIPYLWGGNTAKACDCSGFVQNVFRANGIQLPRDARQQALVGREVTPAADFSNVQPGDLLFFGVGNRITHVGISLGGYRFIHQDSEVHINSFDEHAENFNAFRKKTFKKVVHILK